MKTKLTLRPNPSKVLTKATLRAATQLALGRSELALIIGISKSTISHLSSGLKTIDPKSKKGEIALLIVRLYNSLEALVGHDCERRQDWMTSHNHAFNAVPRDFIQSARGLVCVVNHLEGRRAKV